MILLGYFCLFIVLLLVTFAWSMILTTFSGPPVLPTPKKIIEEAFSKIPIKEKALFIDLGSGTGRVVRLAVEKYKVHGLGVDINPFVILWSKLRAYFSGFKNIEFKRENYLKTDLSQANVIFMYLLPRFIPVVSKKIEKECKSGTFVISQRFAVKNWEKFLFKEISRKNNSTYIYCLHF